MALDGFYQPFDDIPGFVDMAPCMTACDHNIGFNGCDKARCWCNKGNLDLRMSRMTGCASTGCTFANMNTQTDLDLLSSVQIQYCANMGYSPAGMTIPSTVLASQTAVGTGVTATTGVGARTRTSLSAGPTAPSSTYTPHRSSTSSALGTAAQVGIGIGITCFGLICLAIVFRVVRRMFRRPVKYPAPVMSTAPPPPHQPTPFVGPAPVPPHTPVSLYSNVGPFSPPPLQQPIPVYPLMQPYARGDVSPISDTASPAVGAGADVVRREAGSTGGRRGGQRDSSLPSSPVTSPAPATMNPLGSYPPDPGNSQQGPREVLGSVPPARFEVSDDGQITNTVSTRGIELDGQQVRGMELDSQQVPVNQYPRQQEQRQGSWGYQYPGAQEVDGGQNQWGQGHGHGSHGGRYELGTGR